MINSSDGRILSLEDIIEKVKRNAHSHGWESHIELTENEHSNLNNFFKQELKKKDKSKADRLALGLIDTFSSISIYHNHHHADTKKIVLKSIENSCMRQFVEYISSLLMSGKDVNAV